MDWTYTLEEDLWHQTHEVVAWEFRNALLSITRYRGITLLIVREGYSWDGCSLAPDARGTYWASCLHDAIYQFSEAIAAASGLTVKQVLEWGDRIFKERMIQDGARSWIVWLYYHTVRRVGYAYHVAARWFGGN